MVEIVLALSLSLVAISLLVVFYFYEKDQLAYRRKLEESLVDLPTGLQRFYTQLEAKQDISAVKTMEKAFAGYLKHIQALEGRAFPKPITTKMVREVMERDISAVENEIEKREEISEQVTESNLDKIVRTDPSKLKILFEDDGEVL